MSVFTDGTGFWGSEDALIKLINTLEESNYPEEEIEPLRQLLADSHFGDEDDDFERR